MISFLNPFFSSAAVLALGGGALGSVVLAAATARAVEAGAELFAVGVAGLFELGVAEGGASADAP